MSFNWDDSYYQSLVDRFDKITENLDNRVSSITESDSAPALEDLTIGSAREVTAGILFFDICSFSKRINSDDKKVMDNALITLDVLIPMLMHIIHDSGGYVEKNTGDGIMAIIGVEDDNSDIANTSISVALAMKYLINNLINPFLVTKDIDKISGRISIDQGSIYISRIGVRKGTSQHDRSFLTVIGTTANIASHINDLANENQIVVGNNVKKWASDYRQEYFKDITPDNWNWVYSKNSSKKYKIWLYDAHYKDPK